MKPPETSKVYLADASDRIKGFGNLISDIDLQGFDGSNVAVKANYNSAHLFPASTHIDTLRAIMEKLGSLEPSGITLAERSGMGSTRHVLEERGVFALSRELGFEVIVLDELGPEGWMEVKGDDLHWKRGFLLARVFAEADKVVQTCCLKTHRFGGHFTMSLKNSVGMVARNDPMDGYGYMGELHGSTFQRKMIAEINGAYRADLVIMDAATGFKNGGPESGELIEPNLLLASADRVAMDAVGVALLRHYGSTRQVMKGRIFELEQISRAAEIGIGIGNAASIELIPMDGKSEKDAEVIESILESQG